MSTPRLLLRNWRDDDLPAFATINGDPRVAEHLPTTLTPSESHDLAKKIRAFLDQRGYGMWAVERTDQPAPFIGFVGLGEPTFTAHFTPCTEIGWRLSPNHWGQGLATEAATVVLDFAFTKLDLDEVVAFTTVGNVASRRVMEKLGMTYEPADDFQHPRLPGHALGPHVLYRARRRCGQGEA